ncbi:MAG: hypothetical protein M1434_14210 [Chloroflexi bacterium]|nr:hypothetical protein [Chloroflexota bacterium]MCL5275875.1 hypothetical protein [Chloroflexota bacterium]
MTSFEDHSSQGSADVIDIRDPHVDVDEIMARIRENIRIRRARAEEAGLDFDALARGQYGIPEGTRFSAPLYDALYEANVMQDKTMVLLSLTACHIPVLGRIIQRLRMALHNIAIYYVNMAMSRQVAFNMRVTQILNELVKDMENTVPKNG